MKKLLSILTLGLLLFAAGCQSPKPQQDAITVITSFYPLYFFTSELVGETEGIEVINLIPSGAEPHSFEPSPAQLAQMESADLIIVQGAGLEPWFEGLEHELEHDGVQILEVNSHLNLLTTEEDHDDHEGHEDEHDHGEFDPHTWLDPVLAIQTLEYISMELIRLDLANGEAYSENASQLTSKLEALHDSYESTLSACSLDAFITSHDAFNYLAERYGLHAHSVSGISPFDEPSAHQIAELIELAEEEGIQHIYFEVLANTEAAEVLAAEAGLTSLVLNPIAGLTGEQEGEDYISLMETNLENLKTGLACD